MCDSRNYETLMVLIRIQIDILTRVHGYIKTPEEKKEKYIENLKQGKANKEALFGKTKDYKDKDIKALYDECCKYVHYSLEDTKNSTIENPEWVFFTSMFIESDEDRLKAMKDMIKITKLIIEELEELPCFKKISG